MNDETPTAGHNVAKTKEIIKSAAMRVINLKAERKSISADINEVKSEVKALGFKLTDFNAALRIYELEENERNETIDGLRVMFEALGIGGQGEMFPGAIAVGTQAPANGAGAEA